MSNLEVHLVGEQLEIMADSSTAVLFRFSIAVLVCGVEFLACLVGKLIKERSLVLYNYFYSFCTGVLLATGLSWFLFQGRLSSGADASTSFAVFSLSLLMLMSFHIASRSSSYEYEKLTSSNDLDDQDDEDLGIELSETNHNLHSANFDFETEARRRKKVVEPVEQTSFEPDEANKYNLMWQRIVLGSLMIMEITKGFIIASEEHESVSVFVNVTAVGILQSFTFGVLCEESIASPTVYAQSIFYLVSALPFGMILSMLLPLPDSAAYHWATIINCFICGVFTATALSYMIPVNDTLSTALFASTGNRDRVGIIRFKAFLFIVGYTITAMSAWI